MDISLKIWFKLIAENDLKTQSRLLRWIGFDSEFMPNRIDKSFKNWERGPTIFLELLRKKKIKSFQEVKDQYHLTNLDQYRYLQLRNYLEQTMRGVINGRRTEIIEMFTATYESKLGTKLISRLYKGVEDLKGTDTVYIKERWERDANIVISVDEWDNLFFILERTWVEEYYKIF